MIVILALTNAMLISLRMWQAKHLYIKKSYSPIDFTIDSSVLCGFITLALAAYYYYCSHPSYTMYNFYISYIASTLSTFASILILSAISKGVQGPTVAILQSHLVITTILALIFLS